MFDEGRYPAAPESARRSPRSSVRGPRGQPHARGRGPRRAARAVENRRCAGERRAKIWHWAALPFDCARLSTPSATRFPRLAVVHPILRASALRRRRPRAVGLNLHHPRTGGARYPTRLVVPDNAARRRESREPALCDYEALLARWALAERRPRDSTRTAGPRIHRSRTERNRSQRPICIAWRVRPPRFTIGGDFLWLVIVAVLVASPVMDVIDQLLQWSAAQLHKPSRRQACSPTSAWQALWPPAGVGTVMVFLCRRKLLLLFLVSWASRDLRLPSRGRVPDDRIRRSGPAVPCVFFFSVPILSGFACRPRDHGYAHDGAPTRPHPDDDGRIP